MENTVGERIKILVETLEDKTVGFLNATGLSHQNLHDLTSGRSAGPSYPTTKKILIAYPQVNERWLLLGEGEMLKPVSGQDTGTKDSAVSDATKKADIAPGLLTGDMSLARQGGFNYPLDEVRPKEVFGNLVDLIEQSADEIQKLKAAVLKIQQQLKS